MADPGAMNTELPKLHLALSQPDATHLGFPELPGFWKAPELLPMPLPAL